MLSKSTKISSATVYRANPLDRYRQSGEPKQFICLEIANSSGEPLLLLVVKIEAHELDARRDADAVKDFEKIVSNRVLA